MFQRLEDERLELVRRDLDRIQSTSLGPCLVCIAHSYLPRALLRNWWCTNSSLILGPWRSCWSSQARPEVWTEAEDTTPSAPTASPAGQCAPTTVSQSLCWEQTQTLAGVMNGKENIVIITRSVLRCKGALAGCLVFCFCCQCSKVSLQILAISVCDNFK